MIGRIQGILISISAPKLLIDCNGLGYEVDVPMSTLYQLPSTGQSITLLTHFHVREDQQQLFGFATEAERQAFRSLIKISGVGARTALAVLSGMSVNELIQAIAVQEPYGIWGGLSEEERFEIIDGAARRSQIFSA